MGLYRNTTLVLLVKKDAAGKITDVCLAMKKRGFGAGRWNGAGGKEDKTKDASVKAAAVRETLEELSVKPLNLRFIGQFDFTFPHNPKACQTMHAYMTTEWEGTPTEGEEMKPQWYKVEDVPYAEMWPDDILWMPLVYRGEVPEGKMIRAEFTFDTKDQMIGQKLQIVDVPELAR